ncbi:phosphoenolpyruvate mutase [Harryflintia acetispora]|uniref:phosphoenolpyruvate mutase n=1 Tax=Harryflintia acetispora TaxID=1849041 RepID=UPI00189712FB
MNNKTVYLSFSTDMLHGGHIKIIKKAAELGRLVVGVVSDEAVASFKHYPIIPFEDRKCLFESITDVDRVIEQKTLSYKGVIESLKPDIIVHGDDWRQGFQKPLRDEVVDLLSHYGGKLVEFPYSSDEKYKDIEKRLQSQLAIPDQRRGRLRKLLSIKPIVRIIEAHSGLTGLLAEKTVVYDEGKASQFDGMWLSSLCDSTAKGKPDIEVVDFSARVQTVNEIMEVTTKPIILDGDTGGLTEHFVYTVRTLERVGVSAVIIEDKTGLKRNSLFGTEVAQTQDSIESFCEKIRMGKAAQKTKDFMIIARIESLILNQGQEDALSRAIAYISAGADAIMIHSKEKEPTEIFNFIEAFRSKDKKTPIVLVPTTYNKVTEEEFAKRGANMVIYANQLTRSAFPAMKTVAESILKNHRAMEADKMCMSIKEILSLIPEK